MTEVVKWAPPIVLTTIHIQRLVSGEPKGSFNWHLSGYHYKVTTYPTISYSKKL